MKIYVGNLAKDVEDKDLRKQFEVYGTVNSATIIKDKFSGESRGFGFVEMPDSSQAKEAIQGLNSQDLKGRRVVVNEAKPRENNDQRGGNRGGHRSGGGSRGTGSYHFW